MIAWPNGIFDEEPRKERGPRTGKRAWYDPYADDRFFYRLNRSHAHQMFLAALKQRWTTLHKHCYSTVGFLVAIQLFVSCNVPAALAVAYAALTQSFFVTVAVQRKKRSCNLYATLVAALMSRLSSAVLTYSVSYGRRGSRTIKTNVIQKITMEDFLVTDKAAKLCLWRRKMWRNQFCNLL